MEQTPQNDIPTRLGRYELAMHIADGGMATVYLGRMLGKGAFQRVVAVKVLHAELARDPGFVAMFLDEARLSAQIRHPNVVDVFDVDADAGHLFIVMEYIEGASLFGLVKAARKKIRTMPPAIALRIMCDALAGLHSAHELSDGRGRSLEIIHRDISPQNLLVGTDGVTRVTDFGVAKSAGRLATTGSRDIVKGKIRYLAPEQMRPGAIDRRVDVFAAAIILWELLTWRGLFGGGTHAETLAAVLTRPIEAPSCYATGLSPKVDAVVMKALERDPDKRFATAGDFADALEEAAQATIASTKAVGKFVTEVAQPAIERGRAAMHSNFDIVTDDVKSDVASLTPNRPSPSPMPRRRTSSGAIAAVKPTAPKPDTIDDDEAPTRLKEPPAKKSEQSTTGPMPPRPAGPPRPARRMTPTAQTVIHALPKRPSSEAVVESEAAPVADLAEVEEADLVEEIEPATASTSSAPATPALPSSSASSQVELDEGDAPTSVRVDPADDAPTRLREPALTPIADEDARFVRASADSESLAGARRSRASMIVVGVMSTAVLIGLAALVFRRSPPPRATQSTSATVVSASPVVVSAALSTATTPSATASTDVSEPASSLPVETSSPPQTSATATHATNSTHPTTKPTPTHHPTTSRPKPPPYIP